MRISQKRRAELFASAIDYILDPPLWGMLPANAAFVELSYITGREEIKVIMRDFGYTEEDIKQAEMNYYEEGFEDEEL